MELKRILKRYPKTSRERFLTIASNYRSDRNNIQFYAHSYCLWERGSNENNNRLIRRFIRKEEIKEIEINIQGAI